MNLSVVHSKLLKMDEIAPDLLVLPSRLKAFQKVGYNMSCLAPSIFLNLFIITGGRFDGYREPRNGS